MRGILILTIAILFGCQPQTPSQNQGENIIQNIDHDTLDTKSQTPVKDIAPTPISTTEQKINTIRTQYKEIEKNKQMQTYTVIDSQWDEFDAKIYLNKTDSTYDFFDLSFSSDGVEISKLYYLNNNKLFFYFEKKWEGTDFYKPQDVNMTEEEFFHSAYYGTSRSGILSEIRIYFENNLALRKMAKECTEGDPGCTDDLNSIKNIIVIPSEDDNNIAAQIPQMIEYLWKYRDGWYERGEVQY